MQNRIAPVRTGGNDALTDEIVGQLLQELDGIQSRDSGAEVYNLFNHPNFAVPSNTQSPLTLGGNGDAVFANATGSFANNVSRIFTTVGTGRQIQLDARFTF